MSHENSPTPTVDIIENTWTAVSANQTPRLVASSVEPCIIFCAHFPDQTTYFGHFTLAGDRLDTSGANYDVLGFDPVSMTKEIEEKLGEGLLDKKSAQIYVYGGGEITFEDDNYNRLVKENFEHIADLANSLAVDDQNKHIEPLPINSNMFFSINTVTGETVVETEPSRH